MFGGLAALTRPYLFGGNSVEALWAFPCPQRQTGGVHECKPPLQLGFNFAVAVRVGLQWNEGPLIGM